MTIGVILTIIVVLVFAGIAIVALAEGSAAGKRSRKSSDPAVDGTAASNIGSRRHRDDIDDTEDGGDGSDGGGWDGGGGD